MIATSASGLNFNQPDDGSGGGGVMGGESGHGLRPAYLGNAYFKVFEVESGSNAGLYAFSNYGPVWKGPASGIPWDTSNVVIDRKVYDSWTEGPKIESPVYQDLRDHYIQDLLDAADLAGVTDFTNFGYSEMVAARGEPRVRTRTGNLNWDANNEVWKEQDGGSPRHFGVLMQEDGKTLEVWYTSRGDSPERVFRTTIDTSQNTWDTWDAVVTDADTVHDEMLRAVYDWEGGDLSPTTGSNGQSNGLANAIRDPDLFQDEDGKVYLLYVGGGESAIGIARVFPTDSDKDGSSDDDEAVAGTDPHDSEDTLKISNLSISNGVATLDWPSVVDRTYGIEQSTDMQVWTPVTSDISAQPPMNSQNVPVADAGLFFRLSVEHTP